MFISIQPRFALMVLLAAGACLRVTAQDTSRKQTVQITSSFRPVLKSSVKQQFTATPPAPDATPPALAYQVPIRNLFFNLQPLALKPLAMPVDSNAGTRNSNYVKLGYGNYNSPYAEAGISLGDGNKTNFNLFARHLSQRGDLRVQRFSNTSLEGHFNTLLNQVEVYGKAGYSQQTFYLYGPDPAFANTSNDSLRKPYQTFTVRAGLRNAFVNRFGLSYQPDLKITVFNDGRASETNGQLDVPLDFRIGRHYSLQLRGTVDLTSFTPTGGTAYSNNVTTVQAAVQIRKERFRVRAGIRPVWDNGKAVVLPDILADFHIKDMQLIAIAGWTGHVRKNTYEYLASQNPWINQPLQQFNTRITEVFGGVRGSFASSFNYRVQLGYIEFLGMPLFVNNLKPSLFNIRQEARLAGTHLQGELGVVVQQQFNAVVKLDLYNFFNQDTEQRPWHVLPMQLTGSFRWHPLQKLVVKSDLFAWGSPSYLSATNEVKRLPAVMDLNLGAEFNVARNIGLWLQFNNVFNNAYQRWHNYPQLGFQILGGIRLTFDQNQ